MIAKSQLDVLGILMSLCCALHCALPAFAPLFVSMGLSATFWSHEYEGIFFYGTLIISSSAMLFGLRRHQSGKLALAFSVFLGLLITSYALEHLERDSLEPLSLTLSMLAGCGLMVCHVVNSKRLLPKK